MELVVVFVLVLALAGANGANDNLKGVATLLGSGVMHYRGALVLATVATALGALASLVLAEGLIASFGGRGLVPDDVARSMPFLLSVGAASAATIALATRSGLPVSTTHALVGALVGAGLATDPAAVDWLAARNQFLAPLLLSPVLAIGLCLLALPVFRRLQNRAAAVPEACVCEATVPATANGALVLSSGVSIGVVGEGACAAPAVPVATASASRVPDALHCASGAAVCFARAVNDTPKMAAVLVATGMGGVEAAIPVLLAMTLGGVLAAKRVAETMSRKITVMTPGEGLAANLVTTALVIGASRFGLPVSTTHVSCGALFGLAAANGRGQWATIAAILLAWVTTLPLAAVVAWLLRSLAFH